jgi:hypothetical protein
LIFDCRGRILWRFPASSRSCPQTRGTTHRLTAGARHTLSFIIPRRAHFDKKNPNGVLFSCAKSVEEFAATLFGPAVSIILKFCIQISGLSSIFQPLRSRQRCPPVPAVDNGWYLSTDAGSAETQAEPIDRSIACSEVFVVAG